MPLYATRAPESVAPESVEHAEQKRNAGAHGHKGVHAGRCVQRLAPCGGVELAPAIYKVEQRDDHHQLVGGVGSANAHPPHRQAHGGHGKQPRGNHAAAQQHIAPAFDGLYVAVFLNHHIIANGPELFFHTFERDALRVVLDEGGSRRQVYGGRGHPVERTQLALYVGRTPGTHHAENGNCLFFHSSPFVLLSITVASAIAPRLLAKAMGARQLSGCEINENKPLPCYGMMEKNYKFMECPLWRARRPTHRQAGMRNKFDICLAALQQGPFCNSKQAERRNRTDHTGHPDGLFWKALRRCRQSTGAQAVAPAGH